MICGPRGRWLCVMAAGALLPACGSRSIEPDRSVPSVAPSIDIVQVVERDIDIVLDMPAELDPYEAVAIYPKVSGFVKAISVDRGSRVRAGAPVAELDAPEVLAQRAEAQSKLQGAEALLSAARSKADADASTFSRLRAAAETPGVVAGNDVVVAQKAVETAQGQVAAAQQNVEAARQALQSIASLEGYLKISAPFDGVVTERNVHPGALVGPGSGAVSGTPMVRLVKTDRLRLVVPVPEAYIAGVREGVTMTFTVESYPGETFSGAVARIARAVDVKTRTMAVELDVMNPNDRLAPGMFCQVRWPVRRPAPSLLVPSTSVAATTDRMFVVLIRGGRAEWVDVKTGLTSGLLVEVFGDLRAGDFVATHGTDELRPGMPVRTEERRGPASRQPGTQD